MTTLYKLFTTEEYASVAEGIVDYMIDNISELDSFEGESYKFSKAGLSVNTSYTLVAMPIDNAGQVGDVKTAVIATKDYPYSDALSVAIEGTPVFSTENETHVTITYKVTGATKLALYGYNTTNKVDNVKFSSKANDSAAAALNIATNYMYNIVRLDVPENGLVAVTYTNYNPAKYYNYMYSYAVAYNVDESGNVSAMSQVLPVNASEYDTTLAQ